LKFVKWLLLIVCIGDLFARVGDDCPDNYDPLNILSKKNTGIVTELAKPSVASQEITEFNVQSDGKKKYPVIGNNFNSSIYWSKTYSSMNQRHLATDQLLVDDKDKPILCPDTKEKIYLTKQAVKDLVMQGSGRVKCGNHSIFPLSYARGKKFQRKFTVTDSWWGKGAHGVAVIPFRTVAVDQKEIILGTVLYIPSMDGKTLDLKNGKTIVHDGFFLAGDIGPKVKGDHIDIFVGELSDNEADLKKQLHVIKGLKVQRVTDNAIIDKLKAMHAKDYPEGYD